MRSRRRRTVIQVDIVLQSYTDSLEHENLPSIVRIRRASCCPDASSPSYMHKATAQEKLIVIVFICRWRNSGIISIRFIIIIFFRLHIYYVRISDVCGVPLLRYPWRSFLKYVVNIFAGLEKNLIIGQGRPIGVISVTLAHALRKRGNSRLLERWDIIRDDAYIEEQEGEKKLKRLRV